MSAVNAQTPDVAERGRPWALGVFLVVAGTVGFGAAFALTLDKIATLIKPTAELSCNFSLLVQCGKNLQSAQGSVFGFPNPLIGLAAWALVIGVGAGLLAGARYDRWFWLTFNAGAAAALAFVCWLIGQSIFVLGTLCPWCMLTWSVTIPVFWAVTLANVAAGHFTARPRIRALGRTVLEWVPLITVCCYLVVFVLAEARLDVIRHLLIQPA